MEAREADYGRAVGGDEAITTRLGAAALPIGVVLTAILEVFFHPQREDPMDNPAVFMEYANRTAGPLCTSASTSASC